MTPRSSKERGCVTNSRFSVRRRTLFAALLFLSAWGLQGAQRTQSAPHVAGTYSDMRYIQESGDVLGTEIKIVFTGSDYQGALQIAEGAPGRLILVDVAVRGSAIQFSIPDGTQYPGSFSGEIDNGWLRGEFRFKSGGGEKVALHRGKSYWD